MSMPRLVLLPALAALLLGAPAPRAGAQGITGIKNSARRAAGQANAQLHQEMSQAQAAERPQQVRATTPVRTTAPAKTPATTAAPRSSAPMKPAARTTTTAAGKPGAQTGDTKGTPLSTSVAERGGKDEMSFQREVFSYDAEGRRDPFVSLLANGDLRPAISDLKLVGVIYDPTGRKPIAVMRDVSTDDQYRVTIGQMLGRMRVTQIRPKSVIFTIEEFGYSRQAVLALGDSTARKQ